MEYCGGKSRLPAECSIGAEQNYFGGIAMPLSLLDPTTDRSLHVPTSDDQLWELARWVQSGRRGYSTNSRPYLEALGFTQLEEADVRSYLGLPPTGWRREQQGVYMTAFDSTGTPQFVQVLDQDEAEIQPFD